MNLEMFKYIDDIIDLYESKRDMYKLIMEEIVTFFEDSVFSESRYTLNMASRLKSADSIREKLLRNSYISKYRDVDTILENFQDLIGLRIECKFIDDEKYARRLLESLTISGASEKEIYFKLKNKGISSDIAKEVLSESETDESEKIKGLLYTKYQNKLETQEGVQKVIASLARKGFSFSDIKDALRAYNEEIICEEDI